MNENGDVRDFHVVAEFEIGCVHECLSHGLFPQSTRHSSEYTPRHREKNKDVRHNPKS